MSDYATLFGGGKPTKLWVSGRNYKAEEFAISPLSSHTYMRRNAGAGTTDPANDKTNWRLIGAGGIKGIQSGRLFVTAANSYTTTVTIAEVNPEACVVNVNPVGYDPNGVVQNSLQNFALNTTTLAITRSNVGNNAYYQWRITEYWS